MENQNDNDAFEAEVQDAKVIALVRYHVTPEDIAKTTAEYGALSADTTPGYELVRKAIAYCRTTRVQIEKRRKQLKASFLEGGRRVDSGARSLVELIEPIENALQAKKDAADEEKDRIKREAAEAERRALEEKIRLEREAEEARHTAEREAREAAARAEREAEERRLAEERARLEAQAAELAELKRQQEESARIEGLRIAAERQRLADEQAAAQRERDQARAAEEARAAAAKKAEDERQAEAQRVRDEAAAAERAHLDAERAELERQQRELAEAKAKAEREEAARQAKIQAEKDAAEQAERDRIAAEEARVAEAERQAELARRLEALKPDCQKIQAFAEKIGELCPPDVKDPQAAEVVAAAALDLADIVKTLELFANQSAPAASSAAE